MEHMFKTLKVLNRANMGILYNDQGKTHSHDNKENSCSRYKKKCDKMWEEISFCIVSLRFLLRIVRENSLHWMSQDVAIISSEIHYLFRYQRLGIHSRIAVANLAETLSRAHFLFRQHTLETDCPMANRTTLPRSPLCWHRVLNRQVRRFPYSWRRAHWLPFAPWSSRLFNCQTTAHYYIGWKDAYGIFVVLLQFC